MIGKTTQVKLVSDYPRELNPLNLINVSFYGFYHLLLTYRDSGIPTAAVYLFDLHGRCLGKY